MSSLRPETTTKFSDRTIFIGNLDLRITEFIILSIFRRAGKIKRLNFVFHHIGPNKGKFKGYAFVEYEKVSEMKKAIEMFNDHYLLKRKLVVKKAEEQKEEFMDDLEKTAYSLTINNQQSQFNPQTKSHNISTESKIRSIEAKLILMEKEDRQNKINQDLKLKIDDEDDSYLKEIEEQRLLEEADIQISKSENNIL
ncbi:RNA-binding protein [Anaeramoeba ignava]|uniref:RNA-binding protein n=1 Tax=Anaeramoeba ignava TaxID=1746090 RepID=A0A9Q0RDA5_ANAIG|nr:RNA-binding protein [Anaeramoeba ignava]